jgi:cytoskeletal protein RodZ
VMEYLIIAGVLLAVIVIAGFALWLATKSAATAGAATEKTAQATAEASADKAALDVAVQGTDDAQVVDSLKRGDF